ncbi:ArnT family glycosyltransferase [Caulobacter sp. NIBR2454]|uniref:ArnT family glycosyltransferase n=1 Tax=Caulobacter sp. NIBR2454 TaxID=3015996 RepID=UPI0022B5F8D8|nr:glycosyltransferase family 39 protein [Caulobacter sp. NIBR2454]
MSLESRLDALSRGWRAPLLAALIAMIAGLPGLFAVPPLDRDESRFAQATAQMIESGDYVVIRFQDQPRFKKPVGIHWMQAASVTLLSAVEDRQIWAWRIPSLLGAMMAAAACAWGAGAFFRQRTALIAGAILGASFLLSTEAFIAKTDAMLCGLTTLSLAALARLYAAANGGAKAGLWTRLFFWLSLSLGVLVKGPVSLLVVVLALVALCAWDRKWAWLRGLGWTWGTAIFVLVVAPWAWAITVATDGAFWGTAIGGDLAPKLAGGHESHGAPPGYHTLLSFLLTFPSALLLPAGLALGWKRRNEPGVRFALCWLIPTWLMFEILPTKLAHYTLPAHGALAWLMAASIEGPLGRVSRWIGAALGVLGGVVFAAATIYLLSEYGDAADVTAAAITAGLFLFAGAIGAYLLVNRAAGTAIVTALVLGVLAHSAFFTLFAPRLEPLWSSKRVADVLREHRIDPRDGVTPGPVEVAGYAEPSLVFALGARTGLGDAPNAAQAVIEGRPAVVEAAQDADFRAALARIGLTPRPVGVVDGFNYSTGDPVRLTVYRGEPEPNQ